MFIFTPDRGIFMTTSIFYTDTMKNSHWQKGVWKGMTSMIRVLMMLAMAMAAYLVAIMDQGALIEVD